jgi:hypothetical protein
MAARANLQLGLSARTNGGFAVSLLNLNLKFSKDREAGRLL